MMMENSFPFEGGNKCHHSNFLTMDGQFLPAVLWLSAKGKWKNLCGMNPMPPNTTQKGDFSLFPTERTGKGNWIVSIGLLHWVRCTGQGATCLETNASSVKIDKKQSNKSFMRSNLPLCVYLDSISKASSFEMVEGIDSSTRLSSSDPLHADLEGTEERCLEARGRQPWSRHAQSSSCLRISGRAVPRALDSIAWRSIQGL